MAILEDMERELLNLSGELSKVRASHEAYPFLAVSFSSFSLTTAFSALSPLFSPSPSSVSSFLSLPSLPLLVFSRNFPKGCATTLEDMERELLDPSGELAQVMFYNGVVCFSSISLLFSLPCAVSFLVLLRSSSSLSPLSLSPSLAIFSKRARTRTYAHTHTHTLRHIMANTDLMHLHTHRGRHKERGARSPALTYLSPLAHNRHRTRPSLHCGSGSGTGRSWRPRPSFSQSPETSNNPRAHTHTRTRP